MVLAVAGAAAVQGEDALDAVEQFFGDEGFVSAGELLAVVGDDADVVAVGQHVVKVGQGDGPAASGASRAGGESGCGEFVEDLPGGVLAGGERSNPCRTSVARSGSRAMVRISPPSGLGSRTLR